jgi:hypothetical protein
MLSINGSYLITLGYTVFIQSEFFFFQIYQTRIPFSYVFYICDRDSVLF